MPSDSKTEFYLLHRSDIEAWAALRRGAQRALDDLLRAAGESLVGDPTIPDVHVAQRYKGMAIVVPSPTGPTEIVVYWKQGKLFDLTNHQDAYPTLAVNSPTKDQELKETLRTAARELGIATAGENFLWRTPLEYGDDPVDLEQFAKSVIERLRTTHAVLMPLIEQSGG